jgi:hypothetical protein
MTEQDWRDLREWLIKTMAKARELAGNLPPEIRIGFEAQAEVLSSVLDFMDERERAR